MSKPRARGFTLIELLTVIAIIAILVGITAAVLPGVMERSKIVRTETAFKQIHTALVAYQTDNGSGSLPPGYGYRWNPDLVSGSAAPNYVWNLEPYMAKIKLFSETGLYDEFWTESYDVAPSPGGNGHIDLCEFQPVGTETTPGKFAFLKDIRYQGVEDVSPEIENEINRMKSTIRPYFYFPVNLAQARKYQQYCEKGAVNSPQYNGLVWDNNDSLLGTLTFPPSTLDAYALISPGPASSLGGIVPTDDNEVNAILGQLPSERLDDIYYILSLRAYYLATRDANKNGVLDNDYRARTRQGESDAILPDGTNGYGPLIFNGS